MELMKKIPKKRDGTGMVGSKVYSYTPQPQKKHEMDYVHRIFEDAIE